MVSQHTIRLLYFDLILPRNADFGWKFTQNTSNAFLYYEIIYPHSPVIQSSHTFSGVYVEGAGDKIYQKVVGFLRSKSEFSIFLHISLWSHGQQSAITNYTQKMGSPFFKSLTFIHQKDITFISTDFSVSLYNQRK